MVTDPLRKNYELESTIKSFYTGGTSFLSKNGTEMLCTCGDVVNALDLSNGERIYQLKDDGSDITCFAASPDGKVLITACKALLLHQFSLSLRTFTRRWKVSHKTQVLAMAFDSSSTLLATGSSDTTIKIYDVVKMYYTHNFKGSQCSVSVLKFHPNTEKLSLISASVDGKIYMWDLQTSKCVSVLDGHYSPVTSLEFSRDALVSAGRDKILVFWDLNSRKQIRTVPTFEVIESLVVVPKEKSLFKNTSMKDTEFVVTAGENGSLRFWSLIGGFCAYTSQKENSESNIVQLHFDSNSEKLIVVTEEHNIIVYNPISLKPILKFVGHFDEILDLKFFGENEEYIGMATNSNQINIMQRGLLSSHMLKGHSDIVLSIDVSFNGKYLASSSKDNTIRVWCKDEEEDKFCCVAVGNGHTHAVSSISWPVLSTDYLVTGSQDLTLKCWKLPSLLLKTECVNLHVKWTEKAHDKDVNVVRISPNDKILVSGSQDKMAKVWKFKSGTLLGTLRGHKRGIWCACFSPVDQCIATGSADSTIKLWTLSDFTCVKTFEGHSNSVLKVYFLLKGMQVVSSGSEGLIKVWNIRNNECISTVEAHDEKIWCLAVNKEESTIISGGSDSTVKIWKDVTEKLMVEEEEKANLKLENEQELSNLIQNKQFEKAIGLALRLEQPFRVLGIFKDILDKDALQIQDIISQLDNEQLSKLLSFVCHWNTNSKHASVSQFVLSAVLKEKGADELLEFTNIKEIIESLLPYTERHYERISQLVQQSLFVTYTWESMKLS